MAKELLNKNKSGLVFGIFVAVIHAIWAIVVALGLGQSIINWIFPLHFLNVVYQVMPFSFGNAVLLIIAAFVGGYVFGWIFAALWNKLYKK